MIDEHTDAFVYDWRVRFGVSIFEALAGRAPWGETASLFRALVNDPTSHVAVAVHGLTGPLTREGYILADLYDVFMFANWNRKGTRPKPYPRPSDEPPPRIGNTGGRSRDEVLAILAAHGHPPREANP